MEDSLIRRTGYPIGRASLFYTIKAGRQANNERNLMILSL